MNTLIKISAKFNHKLNDYVLDVVKSDIGILDKRRYYGVMWITNPYGNLRSDFVFKDEINQIKQENAIWDYTLITTEKKYRKFKDKIHKKMLEVARNKLVDIHKKTFIHLDSFCNNSEPGPTILCKYHTTK